MKRAIGLLVTTLARHSMRTAVAVLGIALADVALAATSAPMVDEPLRAQLQAQYPSITRWEIKPLAGAREVSVPSVGEVNIIKLGPRSAIRIGNRLQWYAVTGFRSVATAARAVAAGESLDIHIAVVEDRNVLGSRCEPIVDVGALQGQRAAKPLRAGEIICSSSIEPQPSVARGDVVAVRFLGGRILLVTKAIAQVDGWIGEEVLVRNPQSRAAFRALVSGIGEVTIHE